MKLVSTIQQPEKLAFMANRAGIRHGQTVLADVENVMVYPASRHANQEAALARLRFCVVSAVRVRQVLEGEADDKVLSSEVYLDTRLPVPHISRAEKRFYLLKDVVISTNSHTAVMTTPTTRFIKTGSTSLVQAA